MKIAIDKDGRRIYKYSHSASKGGDLYTHKAGKGSNSLVLTVLQNLQ